MIYTLVKQHITRPDTRYTLRLLPDRSGAVWSVEYGDHHGDRSYVVSRAGAAEELALWRRRRAEGGYVLTRDPREPAAEATPGTTWKVEYLGGARWYPWAHVNYRQMAEAIAAREANSPTPAGKSWVNGAVCLWRVVPVPA